MVGIESSEARLERDCDQYGIFEGQDPIASGKSVDEKNGRLGEHHIVLEHVLHLVSAACGVQKRKGDASLQRLWRERSWEDADFGSNDQNDLTSQGL